MPNYRLRGINELKFLREAVEKKYVEERSPEINFKSGSTAAYEKFAERITNIIRDNLTEQYPIDKNKKSDIHKYNVSVKKISNLFRTDTAINPKDYTCDALYFYAFGETREVFFNNSTRQNLVSSWPAAPGKSEIIKELEEQIDELEKQIEELEKQKQIGIGEKEILQSQISELKKDKEDLQRNVTRFTRVNRTWRRYISAAAIPAILGLCAATFCAWQYYGKFHRSQLWYGSSNIRDEKTLQKELDFINHTDSEFRKIIRNYVVLLQNNYLGHNTKSDNDLIDYETFKADSVKFKSTFDNLYGEPLYYDKATYVQHGIASVGTQPGINFVQQIFGAVSFDLMSKKRDHIHDNQSTLDLPEKILRTKNPYYAPGIIFIAFVPAKDSFRNVLLMRYPSYDINILPADYVLTTRQWFRDANDVERRTALSWKEWIGMDTVFMGLSRPYLTMRKNSPNQRTFWVDIPLKNKFGQTSTDKLYFCVDSVLKN